MSTYKLTQENGKYKVIGKYGTEAVHVVHCSEDIKELKEDTANPYIVAEECGNFARVHLLTDFSEDEALQTIDEYLREKEEIKDDNTHLIGVFNVEIL